MQRTVKIVLALALMISLIIALTPAAITANAQRPGGPGRAVVSPAEMYLVISAKNVTDTAAYFDVTGHAVRTADGRAMVRDFRQPVAGQYFFDNDTAIIAMERPLVGSRDWVDRTRQRMGGRIGDWTGGRIRGPIMGDYSNATLNVSGASAVVVMKNLTRLSDTRALQSTDLAVYMPGGTASSYKLSTPITILRTDRALTITGNPETRTIMQDLMASEDRFPADAPPVRLVDISDKN